MSTLKLTSFLTTSRPFRFLLCWWQGGKETGVHPGFPLPKPLSSQDFFPFTPIWPAVDTGMMQKC